MTPKQHYRYFGQGFFETLETHLGDSFTLNDAFGSDLHSIAVDGFSVYQCQRSSQSGHYDIQWPFIRALMTLTFESIDDETTARMILEHRSALVNCVNHYTLEEFAASRRGEALYSDSDTLFPENDAQGISSRTCLLWWDYIKRSMKSNPAKFRLSEFLSIGQDLALCRDHGMLSSLSSGSGNTPTDYVAACFRRLCREVTVYGVPVSQVTSPHFWRAALTFPRTAASSRTSALSIGTLVPPVEVLTHLLLKSGRTLDKGVLWSRDYHLLIDALKDPVCPSHTFLFTLNAHCTLLLVRPVGSDHCFDVHALDVHVGASVLVGQLAESRYLQWDIDLIEMLGSEPEDSPYACIRHE